MTVLDLKCQHHLKCSSQSRFCSRASLGILSYLTPEARSRIYNHCSSRDVEVLLQVNEDIRNDVEVTICPQKSTHITMKIPRGTGHFGVKLRGEQPRFASWVRLCGQQPPYNFDFKGLYDLPVLALKHELVIDYDTSTRGCNGGNSLTEDLSRIRGTIKEYQRQITADPRRVPVYIRLTIKRSHCNEDLFLHSQNVAVLRSAYEFRDSIWDRHGVSVALHGDAYFQWVADHAWDFV